MNTLLTLRSFANKNFAKILLTIILVIIMVLHEYFSKAMPLEYATHWLGWKNSNVWKILMLLGVQAILALVLFALAAWMYPAKTPTVQRLFERIGRLITQLKLRVFEGNSRKMTARELDEEIVRLEDGGDDQESGLWYMALDSTVTSLLFPVFGILFVFDLICFLTLRQRGQRV